MELENLYDILEDQTLSTTEKYRIEILLEAINDWPRPVSSLSDFINQVKKDVRKDIVTGQDIKNFEQELSSKVDAWKKESYSSLHQLTNSFFGKSLNEIIQYYQSI